MKRYHTILVSFVGVLAVAGAFLFFVRQDFSSQGRIYTKGEQEISGEAVLFPRVAEETGWQEYSKPIYLPTPEPLYAIYMTSWIAGTPSRREDIIRFIESSEINAVVIDVKDYTGNISFIPEDPELLSYGAQENRIPDIRAFLRALNERGIYTIARISVFQDPYMASIRPDLAVKRENGEVWKDYKNILWIDPAAREYWAYIVRVAKATHAVGFDELNFDYIRFPSDGNMQDIAYDHWDEKTPPADILEQFFGYLRAELDELDVPLSADLFGMVTSNYDDLNIGQVLEKAEPYFDYIAPMVYPSHYPKTFIGFANPASHPYEVIHYAMSRAALRLTNASSSPLKLRPWIQDFDLGAIYDEDMIRKEKQAVYDAGLTSWMAWDPANKYTREAYK
ncbi:MAG: hypothetical protein HY445_01935 [Candidatus Niyogibacteria bacterium]|nr:hypothetical protein [Candidatus Niyogibacteria bacterium]